ncbi:MAG: 1-(5-phosphoribosyl)-5-[(5-phosphoribosylamino)methylideneamino]imidazole-4-carboxamide isomerase [Bacillota bacterium]|uniref:1-(5-phosphoribosyl)-5-[(5- phosphoribosylamino)methylideneamino]imidazole-4- carboxamide isomerase n=1 Tax=Desulforudis sp. DRI-14 TaxID=3459793 RepID=UPI003486408C
MLVFPAIDLRGGRCVRLIQGRLDKETVYSNDPAAVALRWQEQGAEYLHVVDLDGAFAGQPRNAEAISAIIRAVRIPVQLGGGIRNMETVRGYLGLGVERVILGTAAVSDPAFLGEALAEFGERIVVGVDCRDGRVCVEGWGKAVARDYLDFLKEISCLGVKRIVLTDIRRDGMLQGQNLASIERACRETTLKVIASGGVAGINDIKALKALSLEGIEGVIIGKALYAGTIKLREALAVAKGE